MVLFSDIVDSTYTQENLEKIQWVINYAKQN
jgi:hypothetical protein